MTSGTIHALSADLFVIEGGWPSPPAAVYRCGTRLCLLGTGAGAAQRTAIRTVVASYGAVEELVLLSSGSPPGPDSNDGLLDELPAGRRRHLRPGGADPASEVSPSRVPAEDYGALDGPGWIVVGSRRWPGWPFADAAIGVLRIGPPGLGRVGFHLPGCRALVLPDLHPGPVRDVRRRLPAAAAAQLLQLLDDGAVQAVAYAAHLAAFAAALPLLPWATTPMDLDDRGVPVRGYLFRPDDSGTPRPTVIVPAGYDSTAEAGYSFSAVSALERGMNCLVFEGPGQGGVLYRQRVPMRPDSETVVSPVVDWLLDQEGVDPDALILFGRSFAGYLAPRAASEEHRFAALICDPAQYDFAATIRRRLGEARWDRLLQHDPTLDADLAPMLADPHAANGFGWRMTAHGVGTLSDYFRALSEFTLVGRVEKISCPTLALAGEGDFAGTGQLEVFAQALTAPVTAHQFTAAEGAGGHCEGLGQDRLDQVVYGWLARILAGTSTKRLQPVGR